MRALTRYAEAGILIISTVLSHLRHLIRDIVSSSERERADSCGWSQSNRQICSG